MDEVLPLSRHEILWLRHIFHDNECAGCSEYRKRLHARMRHDHAHAQGLDHEHAEGDGLHDPNFGKCPANIENQRLLDAERVRLAKESASS